MISYKNLQDSIDFYSERGFVRIESPWTVSSDISDITKPPEKISYQLEHNKKVLVGSGEQSFLYLYLKGFLPKGRFQTVTPCFRDDPFDSIHTKYFMKNELIVTDDVSPKSLIEVRDFAYDFFSTRFDLGFLQVVNVGTDAFDINFRHNAKDVTIELGSYGIRHCDFLSWIYATGCAEPRLSYCQEFFKT